MYRKYITICPPGVHQAARQHQRVLRILTGADLQADRIAVRDEEVLARPQCALGEEVLSAPGRDAGGSAVVRCGGERGVVRAKPL